MQQGVGEDRSRRQTALLLIAMVSMIAGPVAAQVWETAANNPSDPDFVQVPYEVVFVAAKVVETGTCTKNGVTRPKGEYEIGTDVIGATNPSKGNLLMVTTRNGLTMQIFPLPIHETLFVTHPDTGLQVRLIDTPAGMLDRGSVLEPNVSEDGKRVIFSYFHDVTFAINSNQGGMAKQGADLYVMDLTDLVDAANPDLVDPTTLPVQRLTFKDYDGTGAQSDTDKNKNAMNQLAAANSGNNGWGTVHMHGVEMRTTQGLKMVYVSGDRRNMNSNDQRGHSNYNLNLHIADLNGDGSFGARRQFQYYTTTSVMSPTPLRNGIAFSYQATTADGRNWHIQSSDSEGRWSPLIGYGSNQDLFHLGAFCVDTQGDSSGNPPGDYFIATKYYNENNNGFGALWKLNMADAGLNTYDDNSTSWGTQPRQKNARKISLNVTDGDAPSVINGSGEFWGKMTSPRCGAPDDLFFAYTPTSANGKSGVCESDGSHIYHSYIGYVQGFEDFNPTTDVLTLVNDSTDAYTLVWPVPVLSWQDRTGDAKQKISGSIIANGTGIQAGRPYAHVGTSSIYNTDRLPYDCWIRGVGCPVPGQPGRHAYNPNKTGNNHNDQILWNYDGLTYVQDQNDYCKELDPSAVLGIAVNVTSNRIDHSCCGLDYQTDSGTTLETVRLLGVHDVRTQADQSFKALIPSHVPFEFHLLDKNYGLRLVDVRSWHSLYPREERTNCGGCHQHVEGKDQPFAGTVADSQPATDMVSQTQTVTYDAQCNPIVVTSTNATELVPEWKANIWPQFDQYCGTCHNNTVSSDSVALAALSYDTESKAYTELKNKNYADNISGALGSPAMWAAYGQRMDGRANSLYVSGGLCQSNPSYAFSAIHAIDPNLCGQNDVTKATWVHRFGQWIDNHLPRDTGTAYPANHDRYHPTADIAAFDITCKAKKLRVGYWDDGGLLTEVKVFVNNTVIDAATNVANGAHVITNLSLVNNDRVKVVVEDPAGNRQIYEKRVKQLKDECKPNVVYIDQREAIPVP